MEPTAGVPELLGVPIKDLGAWGILVVIAARYLLEGGQVSLRLYRGKRNGKNGTGKVLERLKEEAARRGEQVVICPLDRSGTVAKIDTIERHVENMERRLLPEKVFLDMQEGINETNKHLATMVAILQDRKS